MFIFFLMLLLTPAFADVMNLNEFMATRMEDASVTPLHKTDVQGSVHYEEDDQQLTLRPNLRYGIYQDVQLEYMSDHLSAPKGSEKGSGETNLGFQWHFFEQDQWIPSMAIAPNLILPTGKESRGIDSSYKAIFTYTILGTSKDPVGQVLLNYRWTFNSDQQHDEKKVGQQGIVGYLHKVSEGNSVLADFIHHQETYSIGHGNEAEAGWLHQFTKNFDTGLGVGIDLQHGHFTSSLSGQLTF